MVNDLKRKESQLRREIAEKERIARELEARIREIIEEEARTLNSANIYAALNSGTGITWERFQKEQRKIALAGREGIITIGYGSHEVPGLRGSSVQK